MSDDARLLSGEGGATDFEKELLGSWKAEQPSDEARARVLAMAGLGAAVATTAGAAAKGGAAAGGSIAPTASAVGTAALAKWLVVAAVGAVTAGTTLAYMRSTPRAPAPAAPPLSPSPRAEAPPPVAATPTLAQPPSNGPPVSAPAAQTVLPPRSAVPPRHPSGVGSGDKGARPADEALGEEVSALDRARRALATGDAAGALRQLDDFEARFPRGALVEEAEVLRVESLLAENDRASAARVGARFLAAHPSSPHAERVRSLLTRASAP